MISIQWLYFSEVLKQVWDLSDQDNDSMLSLREFCIALYLMERHREGRALPGVLPSNVLLDLPTTGQPATPYSAVTWGSPSGGSPRITGSLWVCARARARPFTYMENIYSSFCLSTLFCIFGRFSRAARDDWLWCSTCEPYCTPAAEASCCSSV